jgi:hypothetical protein
MPVRIPMNLNMTNPPYPNFQRPAARVYSGPSIRLNLSSPMVGRISTAKVGCGSCGK